MGQLKYTKSQQEALETIDQNLQIIACAGSGKTEIVSARIVEILERMRSKGIRPRNIVAFTFTEKAAAELKARIALLCRNRLGQVTGLAEMYIGTIHGFCLELLQTYLYPFLKYTVLNEVQARLLVDRLSVQSGMKDLGLVRLRESDLFLEILEVMREADLKLEQLGDHPVREAVEKYERLLDERAYLDFTKIMAEAVAALNDDLELRKKIAERVKYLVVDEYQDVNPLQESLIRTIHDLGANVCVVGDDDQSIYEWRGTDVRNILDFESRYPRVKTVRLEENFRSSKGIVEAAVTFIERNNPNRLQKRMVSSFDQSFDRGDILCLAFRNPVEEANWIADKIRSLVGIAFRDKPDEIERGLSWSDFAVLLRSVRRNAAPILDAFRAAGIPYVVRGMNDLFETPEVEAARATFLFMASKISEIELRTSWIDANLGLVDEKLGAGIEYLIDQKRWDKTKRFALYNLQRLFLDFLDRISLQENNIPEGRGEIVYYNLGKFSQVISDFEQINFHSDPQRKYETFAGFLTYQAPDYYPEGWEDVAHIIPDAVQVMTVHQAKGMEWPAVFAPCLQNNRFPSKKHGGKGIWHVIPKQAVINADRYEGSIESERRLFYVALTRSKKYLYCTWAPQPQNRFYSLSSPFFDEVTRLQFVLTREPATKIPSPVRLPQQPSIRISNMVLDFSELKYYFKCPYQFKLRFLYGFNPPIHEALGYGKSLHDALAEIHKRALDHDFISVTELPNLLDTHLHLPFAYPKLRQQLRNSAEKTLDRYLVENGKNLDKVQHVEQIVEIQVANNVVVNGRIDLIKRIDTGEVAIVDFKSTERAQAEDVSREQLHVYAVGYRQLTGDDADLIEVYNLDKGGTIREEIDDTLIAETSNMILGVSMALRENELDRKPAAPEECSTCDLGSICSWGQKPQYVHLQGPS